METHPDILAVIEGRSQWCVVTGDCLQILPTIPAGIGAVVTDPPYGICITGHRASTREWSEIKNDGGDLDIRGILNMTCTVVSFGANCYPDQLPHRGRWVCWDKRTIDGACDAMLGSPYELAWTNRTSGFDRMYRVMHGGVVNADGHERRTHPTQKPVALMARIIADFSEHNAIVCDPFTGSGTTGVAAIQTGRRFIGIEIEEKYAAIARRRIADAAPLFVPPPQSYDGGLFNG